MKSLLILILFSTTSFVFSQKYTLYKTGRPQSFEYNNAEKIIAKKWKIDFKYFAFDGIDFALLDSINAINEQTTKKLEATKGAKWQDDFLMEVGEMLEKTSQVRSAIQKEIVMLNNGSEKFIHFEKSCFKNHYKAFVVSQILEKGQRNFYVLQVYYVNLKKQTFKLKEEKQKPLHFSYAENGIE